MDTQDSELLLHLMELDALGERELEAVFSNEEAGKALLCAGLLLEEPPKAPGSPEEFARLLVKLNEVRKGNAERLANTLSRAARSFEEGNQINALATIDKFISNSTSPFFKSAAAAARELYSDESYETPADEKYWDAELKHALKEAQLSLDHGERAKAMEILDTFISRCTLDIQRDTARKVRDFHTGSNA